MRKSNNNQNSKKQGLLRILAFNSYVGSYRKSGMFTKVSQLNTDEHSPKMPPYVPATPPEVDAIGNPFSGGRWGW